MLRLSIIKSNQYLSQVIEFRASLPRIIDTHYAREEDECVHQMSASFAIIRTF